MEEVTHAVQVEPGRWRVYIITGTYQRCKVMSALEFSKMLRNEKYQADYEVGEWEEGAELTASPLRIEPL